MTPAAAGGLCRGAGHEVPITVAPWRVARKAVHRAPGDSPSGRSTHCVGTAWHDGGPTTDTNLWAGCPHDHHLKHHPGWQVTLHPDGSMTWTTPTGHSYTSQPRDYRTDPDPPKAHRRRRNHLRQTPPATSPRSEPVIDACTSLRGAGPSTRAPVEEGDDRGLDTCRAEVRVVVVGKSATGVGGVDQLVAQIGEPAGPRRGRDGR
jgi:hypothetical protein